MKRLLALILALCLIFSLAACGETGGEAPAAPVETAAVPETSAEPEEGIKISTIEEFLENIGSDRTLVLTEDVFNITDLRQAAGNGEMETDNWYFNTLYGCREMVIRNVKGLKIIGAGIDKTRIVTEPREAVVLRFEDCEDITLQGLTMGHTEGSGTCTGSVLEFLRCNSVSLASCDLYGCGTIGLYLYGCKDISVHESRIHDCRYNAIQAFRTRKLLVTDCEIYGIEGSSVLELQHLNGFGLYNSMVHDNNVPVLISSQSNMDVTFAGTEFSDNRCVRSFFALSGRSPVIEKCSFTENNSPRWFSEDTDIVPVDENGNSIANGSAYYAMQRETVEVRPFTNSESVLTESAPAEKVTVTNAREFLDAIAPNTVIEVDAEEINLYEEYLKDPSSSKYYIWNITYDGPELQIVDVDNLTIKGRGIGLTGILTTPRYANILSFLNCRNITLQDFTAGHTDGGECSGGVLFFRDCTVCDLRSCGLFGCGIVGIEAWYCEGMTGTELNIYDCSYGGVWLYGCSNVYLTDTSIRDCGDDPIYIDGGCTFISINDKEMGPGNWSADGYKVAEFVAYG